MYFDIKKIGIVILFLTFANNLFSQKFIDVIPPSPNASSLGKFGETPADYYTGVSQISIPIWEIKLNNFSMPISLANHAGGVKLQEYASNVGLGWALNCGGVITRSINGIADDCAAGYMNPGNFGMPFLKNNYDPVNNFSDFEKLKNFAEGTYDSQPDFFYFNFNGRSGKFIFDQNKQIHIIPNQKLKIEAQYTGYSINQFTVITEEGDKYIFSEKEKSFSYSQITNHLGTSIPESFSPCNSYDVTNSWYLKEIYTKNDQNISFFYNQSETGQPYNYTIKNQYLASYDNYKSTFTSESCVRIDLRKSFVSTFLINQILGKRITRINFPNGKIDFQYNADRADLVNDKMLTKIDVININNVKIKSYNLNYLYSDGNGLFVNPSSIQVTSTNQDNYRLFLDAITQVTDNGSLPPYKFEYFGNVPARQTNNLINSDYWGFYNGGVSAVSGKLPLKEHAQKGTINKIIYPTGGFTSFEYERNDCQPSTFWNKPVLTETLNYFSLSSYPTGGDICQTQYPCVKTKYFSISNSNASESLISADIFLQASSPISSSAYFTIYNNQTNSIVFCTNCQNQLPFPSPDPQGIAGTYSISNLKFSLPNGEYKVVYANSSTNYVPSANNQNSLNLKWRVTEGPNSSAGGIRIKKIADQNLLNSITTTKTYDYTVYSSGLPSSTSTGFLLESPIFSDYEYTEQFRFVCGTECVENRYDYMVSHIVPPLTFATTKNSTVGYSSVTEYLGDYNNNTGFVNRKYITPADVPLAGSVMFPYPIRDNKDWARGLLKEEAVYKRQTYGYVISTKVENAYNSNVVVSTVPANSTINYGITGVKAGKRLLYKATGCSSTRSEADFVLEFYAINPGFSRLDQTKKSTFDVASGTPITSVTNWFYDNPSHHFPTRSETTDSKGRVIRTENKYPVDFAPSSPYDQMLMRNIISPVIQETNLNISLSKELKKAKTAFTYAYNNILPSSFQTAVNGNTLETNLTINHYDTKGNILQTTEKNGVVTSYIWGYNSLYPVAKIINGSYDVVLQTSAINLTLLNNPSTSDVDMRSELNKLRQISGYFVTTYTYQPLVGVTSETDPNGKTVYYEYDFLNRLSLIRDQDKNILKKICYNYAGQVESCPLTTNSTPQWQSTGQTRCQPCAANSIYNSGVKEKEEKDVNPNSPSGGSYHWIVDPTGTCPTPAVWSNGSSYCEQNLNAPYELTGYLITNQVDINPCSPTYTQTRQLKVLNTASCPVCSPACSAPQYKCINGVCTQGLWQVVKVRRISKITWECLSAWCFPDGTISNYTQAVISTTPCSIGCF
jgi:YD repeat-containing protein